MAFTRLTVTTRSGYPNADAQAFTIYFRGDVRYTLNWDLTESEALALSRGQDIKFKTAGQSIMAVDVTAELINAISGDLSPSADETVPGGVTNPSAEAQLWDKWLLAMRGSMGSKSGGSLIKGTLVLEVGNGTITMTGWVRNFLADRDAPEGLITIPVSFNFLLDTNPTTSLA